MKPWLEYFLTIVLRTYRRFEERVSTVEPPFGRGWKQGKVKHVVQHMIADFAISDVEDRCPGISRPTITRVLNELGREGVIERVVRGRNARWRKVHSSSQ